MNVKVLLPALLALTLCGCKHDAYDWDAAQNDFLRGELVDVTCGNEGETVSFVTDNGQTFEPVEKKKYAWMEKGDTVYRAACIYRPDQGKARVTSMGYVCVLWPAPLSKLKGELKTDPLSFESAWLSANRRYLNLGLYIKIGQSEGENPKQLLGAVATDTLTSPTGQTTLCLTLFHDQSNVPQYYSQRSYCSIPIENLHADSLRLSLNSYNGKVERTWAIR